MPPPARPRPVAISAAFLALVLPLLLAAGGTADPVQPATATATAEAAPRTVGELANRIVAAWSGVRSYRATVRTALVPDSSTPGVGSPTPLADVPEIVDEVLRPNRRRQTSLIDGRVVAEAVAIRGRLWVRVSTDDDPVLTAATPWQEINVASLDPDVAVDIAYASLAAPPTIPFADLPLAARLLPLEPLAPATVAGRPCQHYRIVDLERGLEEVVVAIGADDRLCSIDNRIGDVLSQITFDAYNVPLTIEPPPAFVPATPGSAAD